MAHPAHQWSALYRRDFAMMTSAGGEPKRRGRGLTRPGVLHPLVALRLAEVTAATLEAWVRQLAVRRH